jgi:hypothetical protein
MMNQTNPHQHNAQYASNEALPYGSEQPPPTKEHLQGLVTQTIDVQAQSVATTQKAAQLALLAEQTAQSSLATLGAQGGEC